MMVCHLVSLFPLPSPQFLLVLHLFLSVYEHLKKNVDWPTGGGDSEWQVVSHLLINDKNRPFGQLLHVPIKHILREAC